MIDPRTVPGAERIAYKSTERAGGFGPRRDRWLELSIWYLHDGMVGGKRWIVEHAGMSRVNGEETRFTRFASGTLERALKQVDAGKSVGAQVVDDAMEWADAHRVLIENGRGSLIAFDDDAAALAWLYGGDVPRGVWADWLAHDFDMDRDIEEARVACGNPVTVPLRAILPFVDREAFRRARVGGIARA